MAVLQELETLAPIREKIEAGERLDFEDGVTLLETDDLLALGELADLARRARGRAAGRRPGAGCGDRSARTLPRGRAGLR